MGERNGLLLSTSGSVSKVVVKSLRFTRSDKPSRKQSWLTTRSLSMKPQRKRLKIFWCSTIVPFLWPTQDDVSQRSSVDQALVPDTKSRTVEGIRYFCWDFVFVLLGGVVV